ncbi:hypothetical protein DITRI_Ditri13aG0160400 [Diplodiscus trichospermus]
MVTFEQLWDGIQNIGNLRALDLQACQNLIRIPNLSKAKNIEELNVNVCKSLVELPSLTHLSSLKWFEAKYCDNLRKFPEVPYHTSRLVLKGSAIEEVPSSICCLSKLTFLDMSGTKVHNLPSGIVKMDVLEEIRLFDCPNILQFPNIPREILTLNLDNTPIAEVPSSIKMLRNLISLSVQNYTKLESFTIKISKLKYLRFLSLSGRSKLKRFPKIIETMENLISLDLRGTTIKELSASSDHLMLLERCRNMSLSSLFNLVGSLDKLSLSGSKVEGIPSIKHLSNLTCLNLRSCKRLKSLPELPPRLRRLDAGDCKSLEIVANSKQVQYAHHDTMGWDFILFENCFSLDRDAAENIVDYVLFKIQLSAEMANHFHCKRFMCCYPGNEISEKFEFRSTNSLITLKFCPDWCGSRFLGFALCVVVDFNNKHEHENVWISCFYKLTTKTSDFSSRNEHYEEASFEFFAGVGYNAHCCCCSIKKSGVHAFYIPKKVKLNEIFRFGEDEMDLVDIHPSKSNSSFDNPTFECHDGNPATRMNPQCSGSSSFNDEDQPVHKRLKRSTSV